MAAIDEIVSDPSIKVIAEVMGGVEPTGGYVLDCLRGGKNVVSANKQLVARHGAELFATASQSGEKIAEVRARAQETLRTARQKLSEVQDDVVATAKEAAEATDKYVHDNPWTAIGIGAGVGFLLGLLIGRR